MKPINPVNDHPNSTNIKEVRRELKRWGRFWASKEFSRGYASRSSAASIIEACKAGLVSRATAPSDIKVPKDIQTIDNKLNALTDAQRTAIVGRYIKGFNDTELANWAGFDNAAQAKWLVFAAERALG